MNRMRPNPEFWTEFDALIAGSRIVIDRPKGSMHPRYPEIFYPLDYGYLEGTTSGDGEGIDIWIGSESAGKLKAVLVSVDGVQRDCEIKLLLGCTDAETETV